MLPHQVSLLHAQVHSRRSAPQLAVVLVAAVAVELDMAMRHMRVRRRLQPWRPLPAVPLSPDHVAVLSVANARAHELDAVHVPVVARRRPFFRRGAARLAVRHHARPPRRACGQRGRAQQRHERAAVERRFGKPAGSHRDTATAAAAAAATAATSVVGNGNGCRTVVLPLESGRAADLSQVAQSGEDVEKRDGRRDARWPCDGDTARGRRRDTDQQRDSRVHVEELPLALGAELACRQAVIGVEDDSGRRPLARRLEAVEHHAERHVKLGLRREVAPSQLGPCLEVACVWRTVAAGPGPLRQRGEARRVRRRLPAERVLPHAHW